MPQNGQEFFELFAFNVGGYFESHLAVNFCTIIFLVFEGDFYGLN